MGQEEEHSRDKERKENTGADGVTGSLLGAQRGRSGVFLLSGVREGGEGEEEEDGLLAKGIASFGCSGGWNWDMVLHDVWDDR